MDNNALIDTYRKKLTNLHAVTVFIVLLMEIIVYILFVIKGKETLDISNDYLILAVVVPAILNIAGHIVARYIGGVESINDTVKNASIVYAAIFTAIVVSVAHRHYVVTSCAFVFPMILCTLFNSRRLLTQTLAASVIGLVATFALVAGEIGLNMSLVVNYMVLCGFLAVSYFSGCVTIDSSELNQFVIENQALTNRRLRGKLNKDPMTDLYNHKMFHKVLANTVFDANEGNLDFCLAMFDIDDFKTINDTYGHDSGDDVLLALSKIIKKNCSRGDVPFRYGGEEFAIIMKGRDISAAQSIMHTILTEFRVSKFAFTNESLSFSCGIAQHEKHMTKEAIFDLADDGMYFVKNNGKNQIYVNNKLEVIK